MKLETTQKVRHRCVQTSGDQLEHDKANLALAPFEVRRMSAIIAQVNSQIGLGSPLLSAEVLDALTELDQ